ncbi:FAST kinase domain-containing protein 2 [Trichinella spiralis]|uniref:FAST kinase domain-containing protein 2 n=1 Tax=Trichinella spiralis TaxID=6334 RepID=A0ABR3KP66_TRISP
MSPRRTLTPSHANENFSIFGDRLLGGDGGGSGFTRDVNVEEQSIDFGLFDLDETNQAHSLLSSALCVVVD